MIGAIIVTHCHIGQELKKAVEHIIGVQNNMQTFAVEEYSNIQQMRDEIMVALQQCNTGDGVILITDMFGGTPSNIAISLLEATDHHIEVISGVNLPMLVKFAQIRDDNDIKTCVRMMKESAQKYIYIADELLHT